MQKLSVVIICKNSASVISNTLLSLEELTDDMVIYDNGSTDQTQEIIKHSAARLFVGDWEGYGKTKNKANALAKYDWVLSLDADEAIDEQLKKHLLQLELNNPAYVYKLRFKNFIGNRWIRFGAWRNDKHIRLFNRKQISWNDAAVHEMLNMPAGATIQTVQGYVLHHTADSIMEFEIKMRNYAKLNAEKYFRQGRKAGTLKKYFAAFFSFVKNYFFKLGFSDGMSGYDCARVIALYTFLKYKELNELNRKK